MIEISSCSSGSQIDEEENKEFQKKKDKFDLKKIAKKLYLRKDSFIFQKEGDITEKFSFHHVSLTSKVSGNRTRYLWNSFQSEE
jgi:hypothetical protein